MTEFRCHCGEMCGGHLTMNAGQFMWVCGRGVPVPQTIAATSAGVNAEPLAATKERMTEPLLTLEEVEEGERLEAFRQSADDAFHTTPSVISARVSNLADAAFDEWISCHRYALLRAARIAAKGEPSTND